MCEIWVQEAVPSEVCYLPDGIWLGQVVGCDVGIHVIACLQTMSTHASIRRSHSKSET